MATQVLLDRFEERFAVAPDGTRIAYRVHGDGQRTVLIADGFGCDGFNWKYFFQYFSKQYRMILVNYRGHGRSGRPFDMHNLTIEDLADDVRAVYDAESLDGPILAAYSMGVQVALEYAHRYPGSISALICVNGNYQYPIDTFHDTATLKNAFPLIYHVSTRYKGLVTPLVKLVVGNKLAREAACWLDCNPHLLKREDISPYFEHLALVDVDLGVRLMNYASSHSAEPYLPEIQVPTLILAGEKDAFTPMWVSRIMNERIVGSHLFVVRGGTHVAFLEQPLLMNLRIEEFLKSI